MEKSQANKLKFIESYARIVWPLHRFFVKKHLSKRCRQCILSEKYQPLSDGLCLDCCNYKSTVVEELDTKKKESLVQEFDTLMFKAQNEGRRQYDVLLLFSGGKDSAFLLYELKNKYKKLRILAYTVDNGFFSPVARENVLSLVKKLEVDHMFIQPSVDLFRQGFTYSLKNLKGRGCSEVVDRFDGDLLHDLGRHMAAQMKIPYLLSGVSWAQVETIFEVHGIEMPREKELVKRELTGPMEINEVFHGESRKYWWDPSLYEESDVARFVFPFYAWRYDEEYIKEKVLEWKLLDPKKISPLVTNNALIPVMGIVDVNQIGYSSFEPEFAKMIREGKADRNLWKNIFEMNEYMGRTGWMLGAEVKETLSILNLTPADVGLPI